MSTSVNIQRTGNVFSVAGSEFIVTVDGNEYKLWSPPWHEWNQIEEEVRTVEIGLILNYFVSEGWSYGSDGLSNGDESMKISEAVARYRELIHDPQRD